MKIKTLIDESKKNANKHGWNVTWENTPYFLMLIVTELSEAMEFWRDDDVYSFNKEIADIFIRLGHLCGDLGIFINTYISDKMKDNEKRPYQHGRKR